MSFDIADSREKVEFYLAHEKIALARRLGMACDEIERLRAALEHIVYRIGAESAAGIIAQEALNGPKD